MPHLLVEYSKNLSTHVHESELLQQLHKTIETSGIFDKSSLKSRSFGYDEVVITGNNESFLHITLSMLAGRTVETRRALAQSISSITKALVPFTDKVSVEIREMDAETYQKS